MTTQRSATPSPHDRLAAAIAAGSAPAGMHPSGLRAALDAWTAWRAAQGRDPDALTQEAAEAFLDHLLALLAKPRSAYAIFAAFQVAASLAWDAPAAAPLAAVLRAARMTTKAPPAGRWGLAATAVAALPAPWRVSFEAVLAASRTRTRGAPVIWSAARIASVARALSLYHVAAGPAAGATPTAGAFTVWAEALKAAGAAPMTIAAYLERALAGFETVLTPGVVYDGPAAIANRWDARAERAPRRRNPTARTIPASRVYDCGFGMMAEAEAAPVRRITEATLYRDGLLLAMAAALPKRARALSALADEATLYLEADGFIRFAIPAEALKRVERRKAGPGFHARIMNRRLYRALTVWRRDFRPMFDDGAWLFASRTNRDHSLTEGSLGEIFRRVTLARLDCSISVHDIRGCVATEIIETNPSTGPAQAAAVLRHRDRRVTHAFYDHAEGLVACTGWDAVLSGSASGDRPDLDLLSDT